MSDQDEASTQIEVFLVEHNVPDLLLMMKYLKECAVKTNVNVARNGRVALDYLNRVNGYERTKRPDLVLMELILPHHDGYDVLRAVKENPTLKDIRVIIMTHSTSPNDALKARQLKADDFLMKPQNLTEFDALIKNLEENWLKKSAE